MAHPLLLKAVMPKISIPACVLLASVLWMPPAYPQSCGDQTDFLVRVDPLMAPIRPADCATVFRRAPDFAWPAHDGGRTYTVTLIFPDGHAETRSTATNWLAWDREVPPGAYSWKVSVTGRSSETGSLRTFTITN
jgi:hypothetical protein